MAELCISAFRIARSRATASHPLRSSFMYVPLSQSFLEWNDDRWAKGPDDDGRRKRRSDHHRGRKRSVDRRKRRSHHHRGWKRSVARRQQRNRRIPRSRRVKGETWPNRSYGSGKVTYRRTIPRVGFPQVHAPRRRRNTEPKPLSFHPCLASWHRWLSPGDTGQNQHRGGPPHADMHAPTTNLAEDVTSYHGTLLHRQVTGTISRALLALRPRKAGRPVRSCSRYLPSKWPSEPVTCATDGTRILSGPAHAAPRFAWDIDSETTPRGHGICRLTAKSVRISSATSMSAHCSISDFVK